MNRKRALVLGIVFCVLVAVVSVKVTTGRPRPPDAGITAGTSANAGGPGPVHEASPKVRDGDPEADRLPKLLDIGAGHCIPCKKMAPILEELKGELDGKAEVVVIDLNEDPSAGDRYGIHLIPTQIFYDRRGKEVFRHEGFMSKEEIMSKLKPLGVEQ